MGTWVLVDSPGQSSVYDCDVGKGGGSAADGGGDGGDAGGGTAARIGSRSFLISVFAKGGGQWQKMEAAIEALKEAGLQPTVVIHNTLISAHAEGGQWQRAERAIEAVQEAGRRRHVNLPHINVYEKGGAWQLAEMAMGEMRRVGLRSNVITCSSLIRT